MGETVFPYSNQQKKGIKPAVIIGLAFLIVILIGGYLFFRQSKKTVENKTTVVEKKEPTPTKKPEIEKSTVKIQVLNGTGTPGQASVVVKALEDAGYNPDNIQSSNAVTFDHLTTIITARSNFDERVDDIKTVLKSIFDEITVDSLKLNEDSGFDIVVITGGKILENLTPTPTDTTPKLSPSPIPSPSSSPTPSPTLSPAPTSSL